MTLVADSTPDEYFRQSNMKILKSIAQASQKADNASINQRSRLSKSALQPFLQFKLLAYMLGSTAIVAILCVGFMYLTFGNVLEFMTTQAKAGALESAAVQNHLASMFRYCILFFVAYIMLLASVCVYYTHKLVGPLKPFERHIEQLTIGNYSSRVVLRNDDLNTYSEHAEKLNALAIKLNAEFNSNQN